MAPGWRAKAGSQVQISCPSSVQFSKKRRKRLQVFPETSGLSTSVAFHFWKMYLEIPDACNWVLLKEVFSQRLKKSLATGMMLRCGSWNQQKGLGFWMNLFQFDGQLIPGWPGKYDLLFCNKNQSVLFQPFLWPWGWTMCRCLTGSNLEVFAALFTLELFGRICFGGSNFCHSEDWMWKLGVSERDGWRLMGLG